MPSADQTAQSLVSDLVGAKDSLAARKEIVERLEKESKRLGRELGARPIQPGPEPPKLRANSPRESVLEAIRESAIDKTKVGCKPNWILSCSSRSLGQRASNPLHRGYCHLRAISYGLDYLHVACHCLVSLVRDLPDFTTVLAIRSSISRVADLADSLIGYPPRSDFISAASGKEDDFESEHRRRLMFNYSTTDLFGFGVPGEYRRQVVDIAYVTLTSVRGLHAYR